MQLIHLSPELGSPLHHGDGSRRLINFKGSITPCHRNVPCSSEYGHTVAQGSCARPHRVFHSRLLYCIICVFPVRIPAPRFPGILLLSCMRVWCVGRCDGKRKEK